MPVSQGGGAKQVARVVRVRDLARQANLDADEALITLWDAGLDEFETPNDVVSQARVRAASTALGLAHHKEQLTVDYWVQRTGLDRSKLGEVLLEQGIRLSPKARRIPKNSLRRLRRVFDARVVVTDEALSAEPLLPLRWETIGQVRDVRLLSLEEVKAIHRALEEDFAGSPDPILPPGVRDETLLASAVTRPSTSLRGTRKYRSAEMAGAALFHSLIHNHSFYNGNKRTALVSLLALLDENGVVLSCTEQELFRFTLRTAQHRLVPRHANEIADREVQEIAHWVKGNSRPIERGENPMKWVRLKQRLRDFGCTYAPAGGVGNRLNIYRPVARRGRLGIGTRVRQLSTQVAWSGDGTDAEKRTIHKIRRDLQLDDEHDVDSAAFYADAKIDAFIIEYRRILQRLAKL